jgi:hypothetical protein
LQSCCALRQNAQLFCSGRIALCTYLINFLPKVLTVWKNAIGFVPDLITVSSAQCRPCPSTLLLILRERPRCLHLSSYVRAADLCRTPSSARTTRRAAPSAASRWACSEASKVSLCLIAGALADSLLLVGVYRFHQHGARPFRGRHSAAPIVPCCAGLMPCCALLSFHAQTIRMLDRNALRTYIGLMEKELGAAKVPCL